jgi:hypothetical protein
MLNTLHHILCADFQAFQHAPGQVYKRGTIHGEEVSSITKKHA